MGPEGMDSYRRADLESLTGGKGVLGQEGQRPLEAAVVILGRLAPKPISTFRVEPQDIVVSLLAEPKAFHSPEPDDGRPLESLPESVRSRRRSEERRVGKEGRSRWS